MFKVMPVFFFLIAIICFLLLIGFSYQYFSTKFDDWQHFPQGQFIEVNGRKIHFLCTGKNGPSVILDAGLGADLNWWHLVQKEASKFARICSFDRPGYGWSDSGKLPRTSKQIVSELHTLLHATETLQSPYILVGHSFGGVNMRLYANAYPDEVMSLILIDACHEDQIFEDNSSGHGILTTFKNYLFTSTFSHHVGLSRLFMTKNLRPYFSSLMPQELRDVIVTKASSVKALKARDNEMLFLKESLAQLKKSKNALSNKPLIIITAEETNKDPSWQAYQKELVALSNLGKQIIAKKSSHMVNVDKPEIIVRAIKQIIESCKKF